MSGTKGRKCLKRARDSVIPKGESHKIIIGIDYGTTFSGVSYVTSDKVGLENITIMSPWPGDPHVSWKTPTRIAYSQENPKLTNNKWGFEVNSKLVSYSWTKLLLDKNAASRKHDDPSLAEKLRRQMTDLTFENTPIECWVTLPAVWSDEAKDATLKAAKNAGFGNRPGDNIYTIAEPEAAAIATLKEYSIPGAMNPIVCDENILICDCGGGTVDITTYKIIQVEPVLTFVELCVGIGGKCGSTYIDRNLHTLLSNRFGLAYGDLSVGQKGPGSRFMASFEMLKRDFGRNDDKETGELGPLNLDVPNSEHYDVEDRVIYLQHQDMQALFDPVITEITSLVNQQVNAARDTQNAKINRIILVGGFAESPYLNKKLKAWCKRNGNMTLICPLHPQSAVVRGAALRGLEGIAPRVKQVRRHYGVCLGKVFREEPPEYLSDPGVEKVGEIQTTLDSSLNLGENTEAQFNARLGRRVQRLPFQQQIVFGNKGDNLTFKCLIGGKEICKSTMNFDR
ncbi:uncharacterized protein EAF01_005703 [Botrytis porri]|uniref:uncharacterized protein n=1 Tax=Botrytis porri TaxID=87229 RepID=UPI0019019506|nr:uncharacterized protein EAF01_005703 [Botrytis porri]KAF7905182.1 hypothetical protein EAF01_005703 [Botrytis porri]